MGRVHKLLRPRAPDRALAAKLQYETVAKRSATLSRDMSSMVSSKTGITPEDLSKVHRVPALVSIAAVLINLLLLFSRYNTGWVKGFMLIDGKVCDARTRRLPTAR